MAESADPVQIGAGVQALLRERVASFEQLETLLLLLRYPQRPWSPQAVADSIGIPRATAESALQHLSRNGLLDERVGSEGLVYTYRPVDDGLAEIVDRLARAYDDSRVEIMKLMSTNAIDRVRTQALLFFADAFVFGRKRDG